MQINIKGDRDNTRNHINLCKGLKKDVRLHLDPNRLIAKSVSLKDYASVWFKNIVV